MTKEQISTVHDTLVHVLTQYDIKQSKKPGYNRYALPQYFAALKEVDRLLRKGDTVTMALTTYFNEPLRSRLLKAVQ